MPGGRPEGLLRHGRLTAVVPFVSDIAAQRPLLHMVREAAPARRLEYRFNDKPQRSDTNRGGDLVSSDQCHLSYLGVVRTPEPSQCLRFPWKIVRIEVSQKLEKRNFSSVQRRRNVRAFALRSAAHEFLQPATLQYIAQEACDLSAAIEFRVPATQRERFELRTRIIKYYSEICMLITINL